MPFCESRVFHCRIGGNYSEIDVRTIALDDVPILVHHDAVQGSVSIKRVAARFYLTAAGVNPVRDWLMRLPIADRKQVGHDIRDVEFGWPVGMPLCKSLGDGLWEIRSDLPSRRIARVLFCVIDGELLLLHGFIKKTRKTPKGDLELASKRIREAKR